MPAPKASRIIWTLLPIVLLAFPPGTARGEYEEDERYEEDAPPPPSQRQDKKTGSGSYREEKKNGKYNYQYEYDYENQRSETLPTRRKRRYFVPDNQRVDAGVFHAALSVGGNFYIEPKFDANNTPLGEYFKDFGFQGGVYFDFDYDDMRLGLRGWLGYKYILNSAHVFAFDGVVRYLFQVSDATNFGVGVGASAAVWVRSATDTTRGEEVFFLPAMLITAGLDFNPFMADFKVAVNHIGEDFTIMGLEFLFGFRL